MKTMCSDSGVSLPSRYAMSTSPVKTRIPLTSFGHLITEVKRQLFGMEAPATVNLTGWRRHFNSYTLQGRRNFVLATYGVLALSAAAYMIRHRSKEDPRVASPTA
ncbi:ATP synthase membrane subunit K, mitochondrial-like [Oncorhynchus masou masou]|uniref:ATP synthase membrane subunit K, mitochondrial-like n=1 Tax=Oncorhynchus masou masou TaxID=90313 RepID=UPI003182BE83